MTLPAWRTALFLLTGSTVALLSSFAQANPRTAWRFDFGDGAVAPGYTPVRSDDRYTSERGYGFEPGSTPEARTAPDATADALRGDALTSREPFLFSAAVPEGNYRVTVTVGDPTAAALVTIKAELRRLMVERVEAPAGGTSTVTFIVNVRTPTIPAVDAIAAGEVSLKDRERQQEANAWDERITLEFGNRQPAITAVEIEPVTVRTLYLLGDSTVCDQPAEPFASWGQMLTALFQPTVAIANHGESGESYTASLNRRRIDKIVASLQPGDWVLLQFGHNDQKERGEGRGPFTSYQANIVRHVEMIRARGGQPIVISPMERRAFDAQGRVVPSLADFAEASRRAAAELGVPFIDLHAISQPFYETLESAGPEASRRAFAGRDNTHHNNYGAYQLAKAVAQGLRDLRLPLADALVPSFTGFDPRLPDPVETFAIPASRGALGARPDGS